MNVFKKEFDSTAYLRSFLKVIDDLVLEFDSETSKRADCSPQSNAVAWEASSGSVKRCFFFPRRHPFSFLLFLKLPAIHSKVKLSG